MPESTTAERRLVKNIVATLSIERIPEQYIIDEIYNQAKETIDPYCPSQSRF